MKNVPKESLCLVVSVPEFGEYKELTQQMISKENFPFKVIQATTKEQKYAAMAGADIGLVVNGQISAECAALQLPTVSIYR